MKFIVKGSGTEFGPCSQEHIAPSFVPSRRKIFESIDWKPGMYWRVPPYGDLTVFCVNDSPVDTKTKEQS